MRCKFCGFGNGEDDHRCLRCGRRIGMAVAAPAGYSGANALAIKPSFETQFQTNETQDIEPARLPNTKTINPPEQTRLFNAPPQKVIAFDDLQRHLNGKSLPAVSRPREARKGEEAIRP